MQGRPDALADVTDVEVRSAPSDAKASAAAVAAAGKGTNHSGNGSNGTSGAGSPEAPRLGEDDSERRSGDGAASGSSGGAQVVALARTNGADVAGGAPIDADDEVLGKVGQRKGAEAGATAAEGVVAAA